MKTISLYIFVFAALVKSITSFSCEDVYLDSKETLYKATGTQTIENKIRFSNGFEYNTWYIDPCRSIEKEPKDSKDKCPKNSKVCLVKSIQFDGEKPKILDIKGFAIGDPPQDPTTRRGDYILNFEGEKDKNGSSYTAEITFSCPSEKENPVPEVELDEERMKVNVLYKGYCVSDSKTSPTDDDNNDNKDGKKKSGGHFFLRFILIIIICYFVVGACYNFFVMNKKGIEIIPNIDFWITVFTSAYDKVTELFGRRNYQPLLQ